MRSTALSLMVSGADGSLFLLTAAPAAVMLAVAFLLPRPERQQPKAPQPSGNVLRLPGVPLAAVASVVVGAGVYALQVMAGLTLVGAAHLSVLDAGLLLSPASLLAAFCALRVGRLRRARATGLACAGGGVLLLVGTGCAVMAGKGGAIAGAALGLVGLGVAATCVSTAAVLAAGAAVGRVSSISQVARQAGGAAGAVIAGAAVGLSLDRGWFVLTGLAGLIVILGGMLARPPGRIPG